MIHNTRLEQFPINRDGLFAKSGKEIQMERIRYNTVRYTMKVENTIVEVIEQKRLLWYE